MADLQKLISKLSCTHHKFLLLKVTFESGTFDSNLQKKVSRVHISLLFSIFYTFYYYLVFCLVYIAFLYFTFYTLYVLCMCCLIEK